MNDIICVKHNNIQESTGDGVFDVVGSTVTVLVNGQITTFFLRRTVVNGEVVSEVWVDENGVESPTLPLGAEIIPAESVVYIGNSAAAGTGTLDDVVGRLDSILVETGNVITTITNAADVNHDDLTALNVTMAAGFATVNADLTALNVTTADGLALLNTDITTTNAKLDQLIAAITAGQEVQTILTASSAGQTVYTLTYVPTDLVSSYLEYQGLTYRFTGGDYTVSGNVLTLTNPVIAPWANSRFTFFSK